MTNLYFPLINGTIKSLEASTTRNQEQAAEYLQAGNIEKAMLALEKITVDNVKLNGYQNLLETTDVEGLVNDLASAALLRAGQRNIQNIFEDATDRGQSEFVQEVLKLKSTNRLYK